MRWLARQESENQTHSISLRAWRSSDSIWALMDGFLRRLQHFNQIEESLWG